MKTQTGLDKDKVKKIQEQKQEANKKAQQRRDKTDHWFNRFDKKK